MNKRMHISNGNKRILQIAVPSIISNITVPLLGLVDVTIVGHLGSAAYIGAIAVGGMLFNIIYWIFGFLRMGTSGMTSQAFGQRNLEEVTKLLLRSVGVGLFIALCLMTLQYPIQKAAFAFIQTSDEVERLATLYFRICIWGAPAMLGLYGFAGWFIGMQNSRFPMYIAITQNIVNILASLCFVFLFGMKVEGVVKNVTDFGAFIDLGGADGLLHISEMSWGRVENPKKVFNIGDKVTVLIKDIQGEKIALSLKFPEENPWLKAEEKYKVGSVVTGKVARMTDFGAFVELESGIDALLHVSQIAKEHIDKPSDVLSVGQEIEAKVVDFKKDDKKISLSMKALANEEEKTEE